MNCHKFGYLQFIAYVFFSLNFFTFHIFKQYIENVLTTTATKYIEGKILFCRNMHHPTRCDTKAHVGWQVRQQLNMPDDFR